MTDTVATIALSVAVIAAAIGVSFFPRQIWTELNRKTPNKASSFPDAPVGGPGSSASGSEGDGSA
jgi:hypothetical protein